jgi:hypothetical protein
MKRGYERELPGFAALAALLGFSLLYLFDKPLYLEFLHFWGVSPFAFPFLDTHALLSAIECQRQGINVLYTNSCDALGRPHVYSPIWLWADVLPLTTAWTNLFGFPLAATFAFSLRWLPPLRRGWPMLLMITAVLSPMCLYAVERGNNDLILFILVLSAASLLQRPLRARLVAYSLIVLAGLLKFYPFTALAMALRESLARFLIIVGIAAGLSGALAYLYFDQLLRVLAIVPSGGYYTDLFGAGNLPHGFVRLIMPLSHRFPSSGPVLLVLPYGILLALLGQWAWQVLSLMRSEELLSAYSRVSSEHTASMTIGSLLLVGCFFSGQSVYYRGIFFLLVISGLFALHDASASPVLTGRMVRAILLVLLLMWSEAIRIHLVQFFSWMHLTTARSNTLLALLWLVREFVWWRTIALLSALAFCFAMTSETVRELFSAIGPASALPRARLQKLEAMRIRLAPGSAAAPPDSA